MNIRLPQCFTSVLFTLIFFVAPGWAKAAGEKATASDGTEWTRGNDKSFYAISGIYLWKSTNGVVTNLGLAPANTSSTAPAVVTVGCRFPYPPHTEFAHGEQVSLTNGQIWQCLNGQFYVVSPRPVNRRNAYDPNYGVTPRNPRDPWWKHANNGAYNESDRRANLNGSGANGTIGRGTQDN